MDGDTPDGLVPESAAPVEWIASASTEARPDADAAQTRAALRRPAGAPRLPLVVMLHGGLDPLPEPTLRAIALRSFTANRLLRAGHAVLVPTRPARPDSRVPARAVDETGRVIERARRRCGDDGVVLFGSSGGGDLALEAAGDTRPVALVLEEPATSLLTGILDADTPKRGATWRPDEVWPTDYARHYTAARRAATRAVLSRIDCPILLVQSDAPVDGVDQLAALDAVLVPELEHLGKRVVRRRYPGQWHGFAFLSGVGPEPVPAATRAALAAYFGDMEVFLRAAIDATG